MLPVGLLLAGTTVDASPYLASYKEAGLTALFFTSAIDHTGVPVPSIVALAFSSELGLNIWEVCLVGLLGGLAGDFLIWLFGRHVVRHSLASPRFGRAIKRGCVLLAASPRLALTFGRFIPAIGKAVPAAAAVTGLPFREFLAFSVLGGVLHIALYSLVAFFVLSSIQEFSWLYAVPGAVFAATLLAISWTVKRRAELMEQPNESA